MSCNNCDCDNEAHDTRPRHWSDAVKYVAEAVVVIVLFYCVTRCSGVNL